MKQSRWILTLAAGAVIVGFVIGAAAYLSTTGVEAQSTSMPATMAWLPENASVVGHVDLTALLNSPMRDHWKKQWDQDPDLGSELEEFIAVTGFDPFTDLHRASFALVIKQDLSGEGGPKLGRDGAESWGIALQGAFDRDRYVAKIREDAEVEEHDYRGTTLYYPLPRKRDEDRTEHHDGDHDGMQEDAAFAFPDGDTILVGDRQYIRKMLDAGAGRAAKVTPLLSQQWGEGTFAGETFWISAAPKGGFASMMPEGGEIPPIQSLAFAGRLDADISLRARGIAPDATAATKLAEVVRGFVALGSLQQGQDPEVGPLLESIQIDQFENEVEVSVSVPYETIERLSQQAEAQK